jgi:S-DNA-T family DNA segregation ATPase FtsK/SpoIIIE
MDDNLSLNSKLDLILEQLGKLQADMDSLKQQIFGDVENDEATYLKNAIKVVVNSQKGSSSILQRKLRFGYNKAARIIDELEEYGLLGPANGSLPREVYATDAEEFIKKLQLP